MRFTIIVDDKTVDLDGVGVANVDMSSLGLDVHAVQWNGTSGSVERKDPQTGMMTANEAITDASPFAAVIASAQYIIDHPPTPPAPPLPVVSRFQAKAALANAGLLAQVETYMAQPSTPIITKLAWQDATEFRRGSPTVIAMGQLLGLSTAQLDQLFVDAALISA